MLFTFSIILLGIIACKKEFSVSEQSNLPIQLHSLKANQTPIDVLIANSRDKDDEFVNRSEVEIAAIMADIAKNKSVVDFIVKTSKENRGTTKFEQLFEAFPNLKPLFSRTIIAKIATYNSTIYNSKDGITGNETSDHNAKLQYCIEGLEIKKLTAKQILAVNGGSGPVVQHPIHTIKL